MARKPAIHTVPVGGGWANRVESAQRLGTKLTTKSEAEAAGRARANRDKTEHFRHRRDGTVGERRCHGHAPNPPKG